MTNLQVFGLFILSIPIIGILSILIKDLGFIWTIKTLAISITIAIMIIIGLDLLICGKISII